MGFRTFQREPRFGASVIAILALGIGASVAMFSVLNGIVLRPLPYARPAELVTLNSHRVARNQWDGSSVPNVDDWRAQATAFAGMTCYRRTQVSQTTIRRADGAVRMQEGLVDAEFFSLLGAPPLLGRTFSRAEFERAQRVVVLSEGLWREQFGGSSAAIGRTLAIDGRNHVVIGVMPQRFQLPTRDTRLWRPLSVLGPWWRAVVSARDGDGFEVIGRLRPGVATEDARVQIALVAARLRDAHPVNRDLDVRIVPLFEHVVDARTRRGVWLGFAAVLLVLAVACANVGGLLSARASRRTREIAIRSALGAGRSRLIAQLLAESVSLWAVASAAGLPLAHGFLRLVLAYGPSTLPRIDEVGLDMTALIVAFAGGLVVVLLTGALPALVAATSNAGVATGARSTATRRILRLQEVLVVGQIGCAVFLLVGALLFAHSFLRAQGEDPGFTARNVLVARIERSALPGFFAEARERVGRLPGVVAVGGIKQFFLRRNPDQRVTIEGGDLASVDVAPRLAIDAVTPGYFHSMRIEISEGRDFADRDVNAAERVSIVNETMARRFWPGESAIGKRWTGGDGPPKDGRWHTVVGVVRDMRREGLDVAPVAAAFVPDMFGGNFDLTIRASGNAEALIPAVRAEIRALDDSLPIREIVSANDSFSSRLGGRRFQTQVLVVFTAAALILVAAGVYASLAFQVASRTREIGLRSALGQPRPSIVRMIVGRSLRLASMGAALGVGAAAMASQALQALLYDTTALSAGSYVTAVTVILLVAAAAAWTPAWRAAGISPMLALRDD